MDAWWKLSSIFSGGMLGLFLLGYLSKKARNIDAIISVICGVLLICWISLTSYFNEVFGWHLPIIHEYLAIVFGTMLIFFVGFLSAHLFFKNKKNKTAK